MSWYLLKFIKVLFYSNIQFFSALKGVSSLTNGRRNYKLYIIYDKQKKYGGVSGCIIYLSIER